ncbi:nuclear pore complex NUP50A-like isoform X1 [Chlorella sorokiniana]|uniref:Nuclear pore complex NUP50A-like isoform X1 n=1 Tax=Chlorella sorokiniana TaxID=3076 RepID=A0A2P6TWG9_CHLSO|nr:nuclear pore complex NUP50A-like isoform X1 [Chlorella sorokiniana]|eukprot:PRW58407.1 nuclear pore complex NUP50A-like isoform X1 [Chlorella sorokiniana]
MSGKRPTDHLEPNAKRRSDRQLTKDDGSDDEQEVADPGNFSRASEDVIKQRKIVRARRGGGATGGDGATKANPFAGIQLTGAAPAPAANPFAGVSLLGGAAAPAATPAPTPAKAAPAEGQQPAAGEQPAAEAKQEAAAEAAQQPAAPAPAAEQQGAEEGKAAPAEQPAQDKPAAEAAKPASGFGALGSSSGLAFGSSGGFGAASGGFGSLASSSGGAFSFGAAPAASSAASIFSFSTAAAPAFSFGGASSAAAGGDAAAAAPAPGGTSLFGATPASGTPLFGAGQAAPPKLELPQEQAVQTGEEDERTVFSGEGALFEFDASKQWRERGRGEMRLNVAPSGQARLVMRQKGNLRLLLNANLWAEMQVSKMEGGKGVTFACVNAAAPADEASKPAEGSAAAEGAAAAAAAAASPHLATFALRIKAPEVLEAFVAAVNQHKAGGGKAADAAALHVTDANLAASRDGSVALPLEPGLQEVDVDLGQSLAGSELLVRLSEWLGRAIAASRATLSSLRLSGPLHLGAIFQAMAPVAQQFTRLEQVCLAKGSEDWQPAVAAAVLRQLPALQRLQFRFSFDDEQTPQDLVGLLLQLPQQPALPLPVGGVPPQPPPPILRQLRHLALIFPPRSVIPPTANLPDCLSTLTQLTSLKFKRYPVLSVPTWLGALTGLRYLLWDPALPADTEYTFPPGLGQLTNLRFLWLVHQVPLVLPTSLAPTLEGLHVMARGFNEDTRWLQHWGWLQPFSRLNSMRVQGVGLTDLPQELLDKSQLTRLDLMVNQLEDLPEGPYLANMRCMHLGNNHFLRFPSALLTAKQLESVYLANQSAGGGGGGGSGRSSPGSVSSACSQGRSVPGFTQRMVLYDTDVEGLRQLPCLRTLVMNTMQPQVVVGSQRHDFTWLQRVLKQRGVRLTSNELAYELQSKEVFDLKPLLAALDDATASAGGSCSLDAAQLSWGSDGMSAPAGSERSM